MRSLHFAFDDRFDGRRLVKVEVSTGSILWSIDSGDVKGIRFNPQSDGVNFYAESTEILSVGGFQAKAGRSFAVEASSGNILWK